MGTVATAVCGTLPDAIINPNVGSTPARIAVAAHSELRCRPILRADVAHATANIITTKASARLHERNTNTMTNDTAESCATARTDAVRVDLRPLSIVVKSEGLPLL